MTISDRPRQPLSEGRRRLALCMGDRPRSRLVWMTFCLVCGVALAFAVAPAATAVAQGGPYGEVALSLDVDGPLVVGHPATVTASGVAPSPFVLTVFADPLARPCPASAAGRPTEAEPVVSGLGVENAFSVDADYRPQSTGDVTLCAYLGPSEDLPVVTATTSRIVRNPILKASVARHTVPLALRRHGFARRVIHAVRPRCKRRGRQVFHCRFGAHFPGYKLVGRGQVRMKADGVAYRFRVRAQGVRFILTDSNEERASG
jgi:hypothetical protein